MFNILCSLHFNLSFQIIFKTSLKIFVNVSQFTELKRKCIQNVVLNKVRNNKQNMNFFRKQSMAKQLFFLLLFYIKKKNDISVKN